MNIGPDVLRQEGLYMSCWADPVAALSSEGEHAWYRSTILSHFIIVLLYNISLLHENKPAVDVDV